MGDDLRNLWQRIFDNENPASLAVRLRRRRFHLFRKLLSTIKEKPIKILDVGGTVSYWETMGLAALPDIRLTLINICPDCIKEGEVTTFVGDARDLGQFSDKEFDVVFSHSVIEHVGSFRDQWKMAGEIQRVGKNYFIQTPNYYFPLEPHFHFPCFQFLPISIRTALLCNFNLGWYKKTNDRQGARRQVESIRLLTRRELAELFPGGKIMEERFFGITKSLVISNLGML